MNQNNNIEDLFKNAFDGYEEQVSPKVWEAVSQQISAPAPGNGGISGSAAKGGSLLSGKIAAWVAGTALVAASVTGYLILNDKPAENQAVQPASSTQEVADIQVTESETDRTITPGDLNDAGQTQTIERSSSAQTAGATNAIEAEQETAGTELQESPVPVQKSSNLQTLNTESGTSAPASQRATELSPIPAAISPSTFDRYVPIITASPSSGYAPLKVRLSFYGDAKEALWNTGDGADTETSMVTEHTYTIPGTYTIELTTTDPDGVKHVAKAQVEVKTPSVVNSIPNVFTPNGDGLNDRFEVTGEQLQKIEAAIFDKSGRQIYRWNDTKGGWDGRLLSGETAPEGTYFYVIFARGADEKSYQFKGTVTLIR